MQQWDWRIRAYDIKGTLLLETVHCGDASKWMELQVYRTRMQRGDFANIEIVALSSPTPTLAIHRWQDIP